MKTHSLQLNDAIVRSLKTDKDSHDFWDRKLTGLVVRVRASGHKSYEVIYRTEAGRKRRFKIGNVQSMPLREARKIAQDALLQVSKGVDLVEAKDRRKGAMTVEELVGKYIQNHAEPNLRPRSVADIRYEMNSAVIPRLGHLKIHEVKRFHIIELIEDYGIVRNAKVRANHIRAHLSGLFTFAVCRGYLDQSPCVGLPAKFKEIPRDRVLQDDEIKALWAATESESKQIKELYRFLLLLGQRSQETREMQWKDISEDGVWTLPASSTKNAQQHQVPLPRYVIEQLESLRNETPYVFPFRGKACSWLHKATKRIRHRMCATDRWTPHDLRRTFTTNMEKLGVTSEVVAALLNHSKTSTLGVTARYARHSFLNEKRNALKLWSEYVRNLVQTEKLNQRSNSTSAAISLSN